MIDAIRDSTPEGMPAIEALTAEGVNVNVTLLFSRAAYRRAAQAWIANAKLAGTHASCAPCPLVEKAIDERVDA